MSAEQTPVIQARRFASTEVVYGILNRPGGSARTLEQASLDRQAAQADVADEGLHLQDVDRHLTSARSTNHVTAAERPTGTLG